MAAKLLDDGAIEEIVVGNNYASARAVAAARQFRDKHHPGKDLAEALFIKGHLTRARLALVRRLVKMNRGASGRIARPTSDNGDSDEPGANDETVEAPAVAPTQAAGATREMSAEAALDGAPKDEPLHKAVTQPLQTPRKLTHCGRYELREKVARGGMGVVYRAVHPELGKLFAVKVLSEGVDAELEAVERFKREAKAAARLDHPNIVRVYDYGTEDGFPYLVMDFVEGRPLDEILRDEGVAPRRAAQIALAIAEALDNAHRQGLIHRDIKPGNVLIDNDGRVKVTDFGIVKELAADQKLTRTGYTLGSPCYMSPEQATGDHPAIGPESDVYSIGATLYEMLTGRPPFDGDSIHDILRRVIDDDPIPPRRLNGVIPLDLDSIVLKCLDKEIGLRYRTARDLGLDLAAFLEGDPVKAQPAGLLTLVRRMARRNRLTVTLVGLLLLTVFGSALALVSMQLSARAQREAQAAKFALEAEASLVKARKAATKTEIRRHYYDAINAYSQSLQLRPEHEDTTVARSRVIIDLGDRLVESGLTEFAEFVYRLNDGSRTDPELQKKIVAARNSQWVKSAQDQEMRGELEKAVQTYRAGIIQLDLAGYDTSVFERKVRGLETLIREQKQREQREARLREGREKLREGDLPAALDAYREARSLGDSEGLIADEITEVMARFRRSLDDRIKAAEVERRRFIAARAKGAFSHTHGGAMDQLMTRADDRLARAKAASSSGDLRGPGRLVEEALSDYKRGASVASACAAKDKLAKWSSPTSATEAERFAKVDLSRARALESRGDERYRREDYAGALRAWEEAAAAYALANARGEGIGVVAQVRQEARAAGEAALKGLPAGVSTRAFKRAREIEDAADAAYKAASFNDAQDLYRRAAKLFRDVEAIAPLVTEAWQARKKAEEVYAQAKGNWADQYGGNTYERGEEVYKEALAELGRENFAVARDRFSSAHLRFSSALEKALPTATRRKKAETVRADMEIARERAIKAKAINRPEYEDAERERVSGIRASNRNYWPGAERSWTRALRLYIRAVRENN